MKHRISHFNLSFKETFALQTCTCELEFTFNKKNSVYGDI